MRLDSVEIKVTLAGERVEPAMTALELPAGRPQWTIYFCEDVTSGTSVTTPLLDAGVVLRARSKAGNRDDTTVKLRPVRQSQLTDHWLGTDGGNGSELKVQADWAGTNKVLAASQTADRPDGLIKSVRDGDQPLQELFTKDQQRLLADCAAVRINLNALTLLPPVKATRWAPFTSSVAGEILEIRAERWVVDTVLDFLELSIVTDPDDAGAKQPALEEFVRSHGFALDSKPVTKTQLVLEHLVSASLNSP